MDFERLLHNKNIFKVIIGFNVFLMIFVAFTGIYISKYQDKEESIKASGEQVNSIKVSHTITPTFTITPTIKPTAISNENQEAKPVLSYKSLNNSYTINIFEPEEVEGLYPLQCKYEVKDKNNKIVDLPKDLNKYISCGYAVDAGLGSDFEYWLDDTKFVLYKGMEAEKEVSIVDVSLEKVEKFKLDKNQSFASVDKNLHNWFLINTDSEGKRELVLADNSFKVIKDGWNVYYDKNTNYYDDIPNIHYDGINDGFLFIRRFTTPGQKDANGYIIDKGYTDFKFMKTGSNVLKNIMTSGPVDIYGRGCTPETLEYRRGIIVLNTYDCLFINSKNISKDKKVYLRVN